jgi:tetratricopeptide (TPR) repeat protein
MNVTRVFDNGRVPPMTALTLSEITTISDPLILLDYAWAMEPVGRLTDRRAAVDRLAALLASGPAPGAPAGRDWQLELWAERAIDASATELLDEAFELADRVLAASDSPSPIAAARATLARGSALAWLGTDESTRAADAVLLEATERFAALGHAEWQGLTVYWRGHTIYYENGRLREAEQLLAEALEVLPYSSPRRSTVLDRYADVLIDLGEFARADAALDEAYRLAETLDDAMSRAHVTWSRAHTAAGRGDAVKAERLFLEVERDAGDWWQNDGADFLCDAARTLDTLGLTDQAHAYLRRAHQELQLTGAGAGATPETFKGLALARALVTARSGDPVDALDQLQALTRNRWLEKRLLWRFMLMGAWAALRAGDRAAAAAGAACAYEEATVIAGIQVALAGEPDITRLMAPLAEEVGSIHARSLLGADTQLIVRLFGDPQVSHADDPVLLPAGRPSELVRMLAVAPHGLAVEVVLEAFFPDAAPSASRHRLRQVLTRLRAAAGDIVIRDGEMLRLAPAWVDAREFRSLARRARASRGTRALIFGHAALALAGRGPLLVSDPDAVWAEEIRESVAADLETLNAAERTSALSRAPGSG